MTGCVNYTYKHFFASMGLTEAYRWHFNTSSRIAIFFTYPQPLGVKDLKVKMCARALRFLKAPYSKALSHIFVCGSTIVDVCESTCLSTEKRV